MNSNPDAGTVLVLSAHEDLTADAVIGELHERSASVVRIDTGDFPIRCQLAATFSVDGFQGCLRSEDIELDLTTVQSIYYRRPTKFAFSDALSDADNLLAATEARLGLGGVLGTLDVLWINHPARVAIAEYKPIQLRMATRCGLDIPRTLITNNKSAVIEFADAVGGPVVCKMLSSLVLSEQGVPHMTYTTMIDARTIDSSALATTAHLIQEWVPKQYDARVTIVGQQAFGVAVHASSDRGHLDWRSDYESLEYRKIDPPRSVVSAAVQFLQCLGLTFGAFDFVVTPDGQWVMLECNPAGQWLWLQDETGVEIAEGIADLLVSGELR
ncbi:MAG: ATP-grasp ribosomal peptide maturase [Pseudonocardiaceae bacterium]